LDTHLLKQTTTCVRSPSTRHQLTHFNTMDLKLMYGYQTTGFPRTCPLFWPRLGVQAGFPKIRRMSGC